ncbi:amidohydrolase [Orrella sp. JC864]|uniref:amidohydrolase n=1 Tax=Orrella sp. JC864 TaxID=3120298 RepID=UPI0012BCBE06
MKPAARGTAPDTILYGGKIITMDAASRVAQALAISGDTIVAVGSDEDILALAAPACRKIDLQGRTVVPGLHDGHAHLDREGLKEIFPSLGTVRSIADIQRSIAQQVAQTPAGQWIVTMPIGDPPAYAGMPEALAEKRFPNRHDLDAVAPDHPVYIRPIWGYWRHTTPLVSIANTRALQLAGIDRNTPAPSPLVEIEKDEHGEPTGIFREDTMMPIVELAFFREPSRFQVQSRTNSVPSALRAYHRYGTTSVFEGHGVATEVVKSYKEMHAQGRLSMRVALVLSPNWKSAPVPDIDAFVEAWCGWLGGPGLGDEYLRMAGMFVDMGPDPANDIRAQAYPSTGWAGFNYDTARSREKALELLKACARQRIQVVAIWPNMLELFYAVHKEIPLNGQRWVLSHISTLTRREIEMIREMELIVTTHTNRYLFKEGHLLQARLGPEGEQDIVPLRSLLDAGVPVVLASDNVPVSLFHPLWHAVSRQSRASGAAVCEAQQITREQALRCITANGPLLTWEETRKGSLEPGKLADLAVLTADPLSCPQEQIKDIEAVMTIVGGQVVYATMNQ